ncbi:MAG: DUF2975 domain-containing protein [Hyphomicrobiales bacterium]|nr:DUF2975 domain-containing protein [Hyphomicrobiales bacterium]
MKLKFFNDNLLFYDKLCGLEWLTTAEGELVMTESGNRDVVPARIRKLARIAEISALLGMTVLCGSAAYLAGLMLTSSAEIDVYLEQELLPKGVTATVTPFVRTVAYALAMVPFLVGLYALGRARQLFQGYRCGEVFTSSAAKRLSTVGWAVFALAPVSILTKSIALLTMTWLNAPKARYFGIGLEQTDIFAIVFGLLLVVVGHILHEAALIAEENKSFI